ncbi:MAG: hypothetical protein ABR880_01940 [Candidatus Sulfotelmatobacter sp.]|jgi:hypothetical protein
MTKDALLKKLDNMISQAEREKAWGQIEIELRDGQPTLLRKTSTERLDADRERTHHDQNYRR